MISLLLDAATSAAATEAATVTRSLWMAAAIPTITWIALFFYVWRLEKKIRTLEER
jgi:CcmD family protein